MCLVSRQPTSAGAPEKGQRSDTRMCRSWRSNPNTRSARRRWYCEWAFHCLFVSFHSFFPLLGIFIVCPVLPFHYWLSTSFSFPSFSPISSLSFSSFVRFFSLIPSSFPTHLFLSFHIPVFLFFLSFPFSFTSSLLSPCIGMHCNITVFVPASHTDKQPWCFPDHKHIWPPYRYNQNILPSVL